MYMYVPPGLRPLPLDMYIYRNIYILEEGRHSPFKCPYPRSTYNVLVLTAYGLLNQVAHCPLLIACNLSRIASCLSRIACCLCLLPIALWPIVVVLRGIANPLISK